MNKGKKSRFGSLIVFGLLAYFAYIMITQQKLLYDKNIELKNVQAKITQENTVSEDYKKQMNDVNTDAYIEKAAREKLGMVKRGEKVFVDTNK